ncbi:MAG: DUF3795 domain-containing protein [Deltaproteobacteria bacterium]|nr:DUF3795 domain-containing protein [Deltaproteobacteria bacterium]
MKETEKPSGPSDKTIAAVCGLYCEACRYFISTMEDPERLKWLAAQANMTEDEARCYGCRSEKRIPFCATCKMSSCAAERGIDFCGECTEYPCDELNAFQAARPHRIELWANLDRIRAVGYRQWLKEIRGHYTCPQCRTLNSTYDLKCRKCGQEPSCEYVAQHRSAIEQALKTR